MTILIINGPNLNLLGQREPSVYGYKSYRNLIQETKAYAKKKGVKLKFYQSNHEGNIIDYLQKKQATANGIIINPGALTHYSYAIRDCLSAIDLPKVEVHLSNINTREAFRKKSVIRDVVNKTIMGKGFQGYCEAIDYFIEQPS